VRYEDFVGHSPVICVKLLSFFFDLPVNQTDYLIASLSSSRIKKKILPQNDFGNEPLESFLLAHPTSQRIHKVDFHSLPFSDLSLPLLQSCKELFPIASTHRSKSHNPSTPASHHRLLRLHQYKDPNLRVNLTFHPEIARQSCHSRLLDYQKVYQDCLQQRSRDMIRKYDREVRRFGYSLLKKNYYSYATEETVLDEWDIGRDLWNRMTPSDV
jgi:hypothetical protein